jgi:NADH dehydrogenase FAD-containing subunit
VSEPLVIIGNGMAAARLVDELAKCALGRYAVAVIGDEPRLAYNRVLLSSVLAGETTSEDIELKPAAWWRDRGVSLKYGCLATEIDIGRREIKIANDESVSFSRLGLAAVCLERIFASRQSPSQAQGAASLEFPPTFSAPHRRGDRMPVRDAHALEQEGVSSDKRVVIARY